MARKAMLNEREGHTLQPTALVNEAYLKLAGDEAGRFENRTHFFAAAAEAMRRILVDSARQRAALKRGAGRERVPLSEGVATTPPDELIEIHDALDQLAEKEERLATVVRYRFFLGLSESETATLLDVSRRTVSADWAFAKAWLRRMLRDAT